MIATTTANTDRPFAAATIREMEDLWNQIDAAAPTITDLATQAVIAQQVQDLHTEMTLRALGQ